MNAFITVIVVYILIFAAFIGGIAWLIATADWHGIFRELGALIGSFMEGMQQSEPTQ